MLAILSIWYVNMTTCTRMYMGVASNLKGGYEYTVNGPHDGKGGDEDPCEEMVRMMGGGGDDPCDTVVSGVKHPLLRSELKDA